MSEENITSTWSDPDDAPKLAATWFAEAELRDGQKVVRRGRPRSERPKQPVSIRFDQDVIAWFQKDGPGWQTRMNDELRKAAGL